MEGRGACVVNKEGPIKAKPPLCPFFLLGYQLARFSRPQNTISLFASLPVCPNLCSRLIVLARFPTHDLSLSLPAHRKDYHTRNTCLRVYTPPPFFTSTDDCASNLFVFVSSMLSLSLFISPSPFFSLPRFRSSSRSDRRIFFAVSIEQRNPNFIPSNKLFILPRDRKDRSVETRLIHRYFSPFSSFSSMRKREASAPHLGLDRRRSLPREAVKREFSSN